MKLYARALVLLALALILVAACDDSAGPSPTENSISGAINLDELVGVSYTNINVFLVEFVPGGVEYIDTAEVDYLGEYEFHGFDNGWYGVSAETQPGISPHYYGFRDNNDDGYFDADDALNFSTYAHIDHYNIPLYQYGFVPDTTVSEFEPNDDSSFPQELGKIHLMHVSGNLSSGGYDGEYYTGDMDFFRFQSIWSGDLYIDLRWDGGQDLDLYLYDSFGDYIDSAPADWPSPNTIDKFVYRDSEYLILVVSADYSAYYELSVEIR